MNRTSRAGVVLTLITVTLAACAHDGSSAPSPEHPGNVAILVLDNFHPQADPVAGPAGSNCAGTEHNLTGYEANVVGSTGGGGGLPTGLSHGKAVYDQVKQTLTDPALAKDTAPDPNVASVYAALGPVDPSLGSYLDSWTYTTGGAAYKLLLAGVDTNGLQTTDLMPKVQALIDKLTSSGGYQRIVLNMSFVVVPCDLPAWLTGAGITADELRTQYASLVASDPDWASFQTALNNLSKGGVSDIIQSPDLAPLTGDLQVPLSYRIFAAEGVDELLKGGGQPNLTADLRQLYDDAGWNGFRDYLGRHPKLVVVPVAAAGNGAVWQDADHSVHGYRFEFPFAPALWPTVVSVSADDTPDPKGKPTGPPPSSPASITIEPSQETECLQVATLAWYSNCGEVMTDGYAAGHPNGIGTSFAAPRVAAWAAVYLLATGNPACDGHQPALNVVDYDGVNSERWNNVPQALWGTLCGDFPTHSTLHPVAATPTGSP